MRLVLGAAGAAGPALLGPALLQRAARLGAAVAGAAVAEVQLSGPRRLGGSGGGAAAVGGWAARARRREQGCWCRCGPEARLGGALCLLGPTRSSASPARLPGAGGPVESQGGQAQPACCMHSAT